MERPAVERKGSRNGMEEMVAFCLGWRFARTTPQIGYGGSTDEVERVGIKAGGYLPTSKCMAPMKPVNAREQQALIGRTGDASMSMARSGLLVIFQE